MKNKIDFQGAYFVSSGAVDAASVVAWVELGLLPLGSRDDIVLARAFSSIVLQRLPTYLATD